MNGSKIEITDDMVRALPDLRAAIRACVELSGLPLKTVAYETKIEESHLSKMLGAGRPDPRHFPPEKLLLLMEVCGNEIPLVWLLIARGYPSPRSLEQQGLELARLRREIQELQGRARTVVNIFKRIDGGRSE